MTCTVIRVDGIPDAVLRVSEQLLALAAAETSTSVEQLEDFSFKGAKSLRILRRANSVIQVPRLLLRAVESRAAP